MMEKIDFEIEDKRYFIKITPDILNKAKFVHNKAFKEALESGALMRQGLMKYMREQNIWDEKKEKQYESFLTNIAELESKLAAGKMKVSEGRKIALELSRLRSEFRQLITERNLMDGNTAEGQADNAKFNYLLVASVHDYDTQKTVYADVEDYVNKSSDKITGIIASKFASHLYGVDEDYENTLVETKFLKRFKLIDDKGRFLNKEGKLVDIDGHPVDEDGFRINPEGQRIDLKGNLIVKNDIEVAEFEED